jgi:hypothetical protein
MATTTAARTRSRTTKPTPIRPAEGTNSQPKRVRKAKRKALIRGTVGNAVMEVKTEYADRAEFYRNLRVMKIKRRLIAREMVRLDQLASELMGGVQHLAHRYPDFTASSFDDALALCKEARVSVSVAADEWSAFARRRVYYVKEI